MSAALIVLGSFIDRSTSNAGVTNPDIATHRSRTGFGEARKQNWPFGLRPLDHNTTEDSIDGGGTHGRDNTSKFNGLSPNNLFLR